MLLDWLGVTGPPRSVVVRHSGLKVTLTVERDHSIPIIDVLTDCERDVLDVIRAAGRRLKREAILDALARADKIHGESTVARALASLVKRRQLDNPGRRAGYGIVGQS